MRLIVRLISQTFDMLMFNNVEIQKTNTQLPPFWLFRLSTTMLKHGYGDLLPFRHKSIKLVKFFHSRFSKSVLYGPCFVDRNIVMLEHKRPTPAVVTTVGWKHRILQNVSLLDSLQFSRMSPYQNAWLLEGGISMLLALCIYSMYMIQTAITLSLEIW